MTYRIEIRQKAVKFLSKIPTKFKEKIISQIQNLSKNPHPVGSKKLVGREGWRIRVADYRVIYEIEDDKLIILVLHIGHRRDVYK